MALRGREGAALRRVARGEDDASTLAKPDAREAGSLTERAEDYLVAVFEKSPLLATRQRNGLRAAPRKLEEAAARLLRWAGDGPARDEIPWTQITSVAGVVYGQLGQRPVHLGEPDMR